jgi:hypothetical protein
MMHDPMHPTSGPELLRNAAQCGARTRSVKPCRSPSVAGKRRCRMPVVRRAQAAPMGRATAITSMAATPPR